MRLNEAVIKYWNAHYTSSGLCSLCGNQGRIDTRGTRSPAGVHVGAIHFCICPNGQTLRAHETELAKKETV